MQDHDTAKRARRTAAARIGVTVDAYEARLRVGEKWCGGCKAWHSRDWFGEDTSRGDGLASQCKRSKNARGRSKYQPRPRQRGRRYIPARDGDKLQARGRVNTLVNVGVLPDPNDVACVDCGHLGEGPRHEYDHHRGYAAEHHEDVQAVCSGCHHRRERERQE